MKGIILAGGTGSRLMPLTKVTNKHLLPVGEKPMIQHCVDKMVEAGIDDLMVVTGGEHIGHIAEFLGSGKDFNCDVTYRIQDRAGGIAEALGLAKGFVPMGDDIMVLLGDNIFEDSLKEVVKLHNNLGGATLLLKEVEDPHRFGVAEMKKDKIVNIVEKPENPVSNLAVTGIYCYDDEVFDYIDRLTPSERDELEITDVNNIYVKKGTANAVKMKGWWTDAGTHESYARANELMRG
jgi:glucose-1-phosphate thymidylyltransferase